MGDAGAFDDFIREIELQCPVLEQKFEQSRDVRAYICSCVSPCRWPV